jgi:hypothetical protein
MPTVPIDLSAGDANALKNRSIPGGTTIKFYTSGSAVSVSFTGTSPFTDGSTAFTVSDSTGTEKTTTTSPGTYNFTAGDRTGDIDITVSF